MKKINLKDISDSEILSAKDLKSILSSSGSGSRGSGSGSHGSGSGTVNQCAPDPPLYLCGGNCITRNGHGAPSKCMVNQSNVCTCGGF